MVTVTEFWSSCWAMLRTVASRELKANRASCRTARNMMPFTVLKTGEWSGPAVKAGRPAPAVHHRHLRVTDAHSRARPNSGLSALRQGGPQPYRLDITMTEPNSTPLIGVFESREDAEEAVHELEAAGYTDAEIGFLAPHQVAEHAGRKVLAGATAGSVAGAAGLTGLLAAASAFVLPGIGPVVGAGLLGAALIGVPVGSVIGGMLGTVLGLHAAEASPADYEEQLRQGRSLVMVRSTTQHDASGRAILARHGARFE